MTPERNGHSTLTDRQVAQELRWAANGPGTPDRAVMREAAQRLDPTDAEHYRLRPVGWLWRTPGRGWSFRESLDGRTYPDDTEFQQVYATVPATPTLIG